MLSLSKVFSGSLSPDVVSKTATFTGGLFVIIDPITLPDDQGYDLGAALVVELDLGFKTVTKDIVLDNIPTDTFTVIRIPNEISLALYPCFLGINPSELLFDIDVWVVRSDVTLDTLDEDLASFRAAFDAEVFRDIVFDAAIAANQVAQNLNFAIIDLALAPVTGGATLAPLQQLGAGTAALIAAQQLLLGGS